MADILVLFHSVSGGAYRLARAVAEGIEAVDGCRAELRRVPDIDDGDSIFGGQVQERPPGLLDLPTASPGDLKNFDGFAVGCPLYFGRLSSAMAYFWDHTGKQWGDITGKTATAFVAGGSGAGSETAIAQSIGFLPAICGLTLYGVFLSLWSTFAAHGLTIVPLGIRAKSASGEGDVTGAGSFGAASIGNGPGERPSAPELAAARIQGAALAEVTRALVAG